MMKAEITSTSSGNSENQLNIGVRKLLFSSGKLPVIPYSPRPTALNTEVFFLRCF